MKLAQQFWKSENSAASTLVGLANDEGRPCQIGARDRSREGMNHYFQSGCKVPVRWLRLLALATLSMIFLGSGASQTQVSDRTTSRKLFSLRAELEDRHSLAQDSALYLAKTAIVGLYVDRHVALAILEGACHEHLYSQPKLLKIIENRARLSDPREAAEYLRAYQSAIAYSPHRGSAIQKTLNGLVGLKSDEHSFSAKEREFIEGSLKDADPSDRIWAGNLLIGKQNLDAQSKDWAMVRIRRQITMSAAPTRQIWEFIGRVFEARNGTH